MKTKIKNRKYGVNIELNIKNENNQQSKNKYVPDLQTNVDDPEPAPQSQVQHYVPYFNKNMVLSGEPMYNSKRYGFNNRNPLVEPQGSADIPEQINEDEMNQSVEPQYDMPAEEESQVKMEEPVDEESIMPDMPSEAMLDDSMFSEERSREVMDEERRREELRRLEEEIRPAEEDIPKIDVGDDDEENYITDDDVPDEIFFSSEERREYFDNLRGDKKKQNYRNNFLKYLNILYKSLTIRNYGRRLDEDKLKRYFLWEDLRENLNNNSSHYVFYKKLLDKYDNKRRR